MEARVIEYPRSGGLDYHHNSPLIGEIPTNDYTHFHRSIDQLRSLNERGIFVPSSTSPIVLQASGVYSEIKINDEGKMLNEYQSNAKSMRRINGEIIEDENVADDYQHKKDNANVAGSNFRIVHSPQQYTLTASTISPTNVQNIHHQQNTFDPIEQSHENENQNKSKV